MALSAAERWWGVLSAQDSKGTSVLEDDAHYELRTFMTPSAVIPIARNHDDCTIDQRIPEYTWTHDGFSYHNWPQAMVMSKQRASR